DAPEKDESEEELALATNEAAPPVEEALKTHGDSVPAQEPGPKDAPPKGEASKAAPPPADKTATKNAPATARAPDAALRTHGDSVQASEAGRLADGSGARAAHSGTQPARPPEKTAPAKTAAPQHAPSRPAERPLVRVPDGWPGSIRPSDRSHAKPAKAPPA